MRCYITLRSWSIALWWVVWLWLVMHLNHLWVLEVILNLAHVGLSIFLKFSPNNLLVVLHSTVHILFDTLVHEFLQLFISEHFGWDHRFLNLYWWRHNWSHYNIITNISNWLNNINLLLNLIRLILIKINLDSFGFWIVIWHLYWREFLLLDVMFFRG
jgi:hypothetical protein